MVIQVYAFYDWVPTLFLLVSLALSTVFNRCLLSRTRFALSSEQPQAATHNISKEFHKEKDATWYQSLSLAIWNLTSMAISVLIDKVWSELASEVPRQLGPQMNQNGLSSRGEGHGYVCSVYCPHILLSTGFSANIRVCHCKTTRLVLFLFQSLGQVWLHF